MAKCVVLPKRLLLICTFSSMTHSCAGYSLVLTGQIGNKTYTTETGRTIIERQQAVVVLQMVSQENKVNFSHFTTSIKLTVLCLSLYWDQFTGWAHCLILTFHCLWTSTHSLSLQSSNYLLQRRSGCLALKKSEDIQRSQQLFKEVSSYSFRL